MEVRAINIPEELKIREQWVCWKYETISSRKKPAKVPYSPSTGKKASVTKPTTWDKLITAKSAYQNPHHNYDGIGFVLTPNDGIVSVDIDDEEVIRRMFSGNAYMSRQGRASRKPSRPQKAVRGKHFQARCCSPGLLHIMLASRFQATRPATLRNLVYESTLPLTLDSEPNSSSSKTNSMSDSCSASNA